MTVTFGFTGDGGGFVNGRPVLAVRTDSSINVNNNNNNNNNGPAPTSSMAGKDMNVRRVLFGPPSDPAETRAWLDEQLYAATAADSQSWNFDFINERPMRDGPNTRYVWERVCPPQPQRLDDAGGSDSLTEQDCRRTAGKQRQSKVTDFMSKTKKRPLSVAGSLYSNKVGEELAASANKRSRRSATAVMA